MTIFAADAAVSTPPGLEGRKRSLTQEAASDVESMLELSVYLASQAVLMPAACLTFENVRIISSLEHI